MIFVVLSSGKFVNRFMLIIYMLTLLVLGLFFIPKFNPSSISSENKELRDGNSIAIVINSWSFPFPTGLDENHNPYLDYIQRNVGLDVHVELPPVPSYEKMIDTIISMDQNHPDMISINSPIQFAKFVTQNKLQPLDHWIDEYGGDLKRLIPEELWNRVRYNGSIYAIPSGQLVQGKEVIYIRKDWLDKLNLPIPVTLEDYKATIKAFSEDDPDGNGKRDTYGFTMMKDLYHSSPFFGAFGVQLNQWTERGGKLVYANVLPEMEEALSFFADLYRHGWIDPDFPIYRSNVMNEKIIDGKIGMFSGAWYDTRGVIAQSLKKDPKANWITIDYPLGKKGKQGVGALNPVSGYQVVPKGSSYACEVIQFLNFIAGKGRTSLVLGFQNQVWDWKDGKIVSNFNEHDKHLYRGIYSALVNVDERWLLRARMDSYDKKFRLNENIEKLEKHVVQDAYGGPPPPTLVRKWNELNSLQEVFVKIVLGLESQNSFNDYVKQWYESGGTQVTKEVNEWHESHK